MALSFIKEYSTLLYVKFFFIVSHTSIYKKIYYVRVRIKIKNFVKSRKSFIKNNCLSIFSTINGVKCSIVLCKDVTFVIVDGIHFSLITQKINIKDSRLSIHDIAHIFNIPITCFQERDGNIYIKDQHEVFKRILDKILFRISSGLYH